MVRIKNWKKWMLFLIPFIMVVIVLVVFLASSRALTTVPNNLVLVHEGDGVTNKDDDGYTNLGLSASAIKIRKAKYEENGTTKYVYVYCMEGGVGNIYPGSNMKIVTDDKYVTETGEVNDDGIRYIVANGFWGDAGKEMTNEDKMNYSVTQLAIWLYYYDTEEDKSDKNNRIASLAKEIRTTKPTITDANHKAILDKAEELCTGAKNARTNGLPKPEMTVNDVNGGLKISSDNNYIESEEVIVVLKGITNYNATVNNNDFSIVSENGEVKTTFSGGEKIKIRVPKDKVTSNLNVTLKLTAKAKNYLPYLYDPGYAICPENSTSCTPGATMFPKQKVVYTPNDQEITLEKSIDFDYGLNKKIVISKQDATNSKEVPGAKLKLVDEQGNLVKEWTSTDKPYELELKPGKYSLTETIAPEGYALSTETVTFTVNEDGTTDPKNIVMQNKYIEVPKTALDTPKVLIVAFTAFAILGIGLVYLANKKQKNI